MTIVHDYNHDKYTHDNANNIHVASSAPMADHFLHSDTRAYVYNESILKKSEHEGSGLSADSVDCRSFMDLSAEAPTKSSNETCDAPPADEVQVTSLKGRRARERASAPPPTLHGLQFLDLSDGAHPSVPLTHGKSQSLGGLPVRARSQGNRKKEARRLPRPEIIDSTASQQREGDVVTATNDRSHTHGRSKSQPTSSVRLGNPRRPYYSAIRPHMGVGTSLSQPSSPIRANYDSRPESRGAASRPGSSAAYLSPSYPTSRASSPTPSYMHTQVRSKSFLDIDVLDDEDYLFSSLTPPSTLPAVYAQAYSPSEINVHRTGMSFGGIGLGLGNGVFGSPEVAIGPRPTSSLGFRESTSTTRGDCGDSLREMSRFGSTRRLGKTRFSLSRVWKWKEPATQGDFSSRTDDIVPSDVDENGVRRSKHHLASDLGKLRDMGKDAGRKGVEGVAESMKKVGRSLRGLKSFVDRRSK
ncbi:hypothetical protein ONZ45_g2464 [Pleurotus djamor]|nr:hypothetical protein ONZ45_g2464 [Pleurotus djamor]